MIRFAVVTVSDRCSRQESVDNSGPILQDLIVSSRKFTGAVIDNQIVPDELDQIRNVLCILSEPTADGDKKVDIVITTGGTGFAARDVTPEATNAVIDKEANGLAVALIQRSLQFTPNAALSRLVAGIRNRTLIVNFPGSSKAVEECWQVLEPIAKHAVDLLNENLPSVSRMHWKINNNCECNQRGSCHSPNVSVADRPRHSKYPMISVDEAKRIISADGNASRKTKITVDLYNCMTYVLAEDVFAVEPQPPFPASIKDGYAVIASDGTGTRKVMDAITAGSKKATIVEPCYCARISTGAPVPVGADAVVQVEDTELVGQKDGEETVINIKVPPNVGQDIRPVGCDVKVGECVLKAGCFLDSAEVGILASIGRQTVHVYSKPSVAVISTGDELVEYCTSTPLPFGKIRDSNGPQLLALLNRYGFHVKQTAIALDNRDSVVSCLHDAFSVYDVVITSGGVSMGEKDLIKDILIDTFGFTVHFARIFMKPGKPTTFATGTVGGSKKIIFALPGNPVSAWVTAQLYVVPALKRLSGDPRPQFAVIKVKIQHDIKNLDPRPEYCRAVTIKNADDEVKDIVEARVIESNQMSSRLVSNRHANLLLKLPPLTDKKHSVKAGELLDALVIGAL